MKTKADFQQMLEHSFAMVRDNYADIYQSSGRLEYLSMLVFDFTTYDNGLDDFFARKAIEVCRAVTARTTFDYIKDPENHRWYVAMCNMPFFAGRLEWGMSIRGAWWDHKPPALECCGLFAGWDQIEKLEFASEPEWVEFVLALLEFAAPEMSGLPPRGVSSSSGEL